MQASVWGDSAKKKLIIQVVKTVLLMKEILQDRLSESATIILLYVAVIATPNEWRKVHTVVQDNIRM